MNLKEKTEKSTKLVEHKITIKKLKKQVQGITLIALVVTIIVLLILAGIALNLTIGQNGIFSRAQTAANTWRNAETNEQLAMGELENWIENSVPKPPEPIEDLEEDVVYYADFEGDGTADGIIFADLKVGNRGDGNWGDLWGDYTIPTEEGLKEYYVVNESYTEAKFGGLTGELIAPAEGTSGKDRFYVMALEDFNPGTRYCWYDAANGNLDSQYNESSTASDFAVAGAEPTGKTNTERMIASWNSSEYGAQNNNGTYEDMWGAIQDEVADGWFVPSKSEWSAFGGEVLELNNITSSNYDDYGLSSRCWSSSHYDDSLAFSALLDGGYLSNFGVYYYHSVRLATTF